jgi:multiple sugar transport system substrate-binding protein
VLHPGSLKESKPLRGRSRRPVALLTVVGAVALVAAACGSSSKSPAPSGQGVTPSAQHPVTITFANWADAETATRPGIEAMISQFEQTHPGITVVSQPISFTDIGHTLILRQQSGNPPDVAELAGNDTFAVADTGALAPLDSYLKSGVYGSAVLAEGMYQGKVIALPWNGDPPGLWYNKTLMSQAGLDPNSPPTTTTQFLNDLAAIKAKLPGVLPFGIDTTNRSFALAVDWPWMKTFGATPFNGSTATANTPQMTAFLTFMQTLAQKGYITANHKIGEYRPLAAQNKVAFVWDQPVLQGVVQSTNHETDAQFFANWGVTAMPAGPSGKSYTIDQGHQLVIFNSSKQKIADWEFINWLASDPAAVAGYTLKYESSLPTLAHPNAQIQAEINTPILQAFINKVLPTLVQLPYGATFSEAYTPIMAGVQSAVTSSTPPATIASNIQSGLQNAFK